MSTWLKRVFLCAATVALMATATAYAQDSGRPGFRTRHAGAIVDLRPTGPVPDQYIVVFRQDVPNPRGLADDLSRRNRFSLHRTFSHALKGFSGHMSAQMAEALRRDPNVALVEQDVYAHTAVQTLPTGVDRIDADMNLYAVDPVDVDVAIIDTGVSAHSDLNVVEQVNFTSESSATDQNGHGTHVAGTVAAMDNTIGVIGVAPGARIHSVKVLDSNGSGTFSDVIEGIDWVTAHANVIEAANMSLSGVGYLASLRQAIQNSVAAGVVYVVAAGNSSQDVYGANGTLETSAPSRFCRFNGTCADDVIPASYPEVAAISALADADGQAGGTGGGTSYGPDDTLASFSNYSNSVVSGNPVSSPGRAIDLAAPGVDITSTWLGNGYNTISGTSMASPHVTGAVALYIAEHGRANDAAGVYAIRQALIDAAQPQGEWRGGGATNDPDGHPEGLVFVADSGGGGGTGGTTPANTAPTVNITSPTNNDTFQAGDQVNFAATADDNEDGILTSAIEWTSDKDGAIGSGGSFSTTGLSVNDHTITAAVTDSGGTAGSATVHISVVQNNSGGAPGDQAVASVDSISYSASGSRFRTDLFVTITLVDGLGDGVSGAAISINLTRNGSTVASGTGTTGSTGVVTFRLRRARSGTYSTTITGVTADGLSWDGNTPSNQFTL